MNIRSLVLTLFGIGIGVWLPAVGHAQTTGAFDIYRIELVVFEHQKAATHNKMQVGRMQLFEDAKALSSPLLDYHQTRPKPAPESTKPFPLSQWVAWLEAQALLHANAPFIGPIAPVEVATPQIDYPRTHVALLDPGGRFGPALQRLIQSNAYRVLVQFSWYQTSQQNNRPIRIGNHHTLTQQLTSLPWTLPKGAWLEHGPFLDGQLRLTHNRFLSVELELNRHWLAQATSGPLAPAWLAPTGFAIEQIKETRVIEPGVFVYFDHPSLGVLMLIEKKQPPQ